MEKIYCFRLDYDPPKPSDRRHGYSVCVNGWWVVDFEPCLIIALVKAWRRWRARDFRRER